MGSLDLLSPSLSPPRVVIIDKNAHTIVMLSW
jgi:hypothetical protein